MQYARNGYYVTVDGGQLYMDDVMSNNNIWKVHKGLAGGTNTYSLESRGNPG